MHRGNEKCIHNFRLKIQFEGKFGRPRHNSNIKLDLKKQGVWMLTVFNWLKVRVTDSLS